MKTLGLFALAGTFVLLALVSAEAAGTYDPRQAKDGQSTTITTPYNSPTPPTTPPPAVCRRNPRLEGCRDQPHAPAVQTTAVYEAPMLNGHRIAWCKTAGSADCGKPVADQFCSIIDSGRFPRGGKFGMEVRVPNTAYIGTNDICPNESCPAFKIIVCAK